MKAVHLSIEADAEAVAHAAADLFVARARAAIAARARFTVALSGGSTPRRFHEVLAEEHVRDVAWGAVWVLFSDERAVPEDHPESNVRMAKETLLGRVPLPAAQVWVPDAAAPDLEAAAAAYAAKVREVAGGAVDLVILGMGTDGHTASLFPGAAAPGEQEVAAVLAPPGASVARRLSFTYAALAKARELCVLVTGAEKATRLREVLLGGTALPLARVLSARGGAGVTVLADRAAAAELASGWDRTKGAAGA